ncbi:MAG: AAA family ATPase, partial [Elusimicrobiales bacterium]|nr:AAA family ATPase [Elusimicrobiales bacterium]
MSLQEKKLIRPLPIGISEFKEIIDEHCYYSDKTLFIKKLLDTAAKAILFARPRRFGKTLNMTMLRTFFEKPLDGQDTSHYFKDLAIWKAGEKYAKEQGKRPVIYISFRGIKGTSFKESLADIKSLISEEFKRHDYLRASEALIEADKKIFAETADGNAADTYFRMSMLHLSKMLKQHHGLPALILIDEYDAPIQTANDYGYYEDMVNFMRIFLSAAFKDNPYLYRGVLTGITRVSKESIFSGLNNLKVDTIFDDYFSDCFGLTKTEVSDMLDFYDVSDKK